MDAVIGYPAKTLFEYLYIFGSNLTYNWEKEEDSLLISRQRKALILETMTDQDLKDLIYYKRKAGEEYENLAWELARRSGKNLKYDPEEQRRILEEKKASTSILEIVESYIGQNKYRRGSLIRCPLPGHKDGTPSMSINDKKGAWKCFGCNKGGGQIDFIMEMEQCSLKDAITKFLQF